MLTIRYTARFRKDYKAIKKRGYDTRLLERVLEILCSKQPLPLKYKDHDLSGDYKECFYGIKGTSENPKLRKK